MTERKTFEVTKALFRAPGAKEKIAEFLKSKSTVKAKNAKNAAATTARKIIKLLDCEERASTIIDLHLECPSTGKKYQCKVHRQKLSEPKTIVCASGPVTFQHSTAVEVHTSKAAPI